MKNAYDYNRAEKLIPLIQAIHRELRERSEAIRDLNIQLHQMRQGSQPLTREERVSRERHVQASLANHKREIRLANKELARFGCLIDEDNPFRVLIPGNSGEFRDGYSWRVGDEQVRALVQEGPNEAA